MPKFSYRKPDHWQIDFWLVFNANGSVRMVRGEPEMYGYERAMRVVARVPHSLFRVPQLSATITLGEKETPDAHIDIPECALSEALGVRVEIAVQGEQA